MTKNKPLDSYLCQKCGHTWEQEPKKHPRCPICGEKKQLFKQFSGEYPQMTDGYPLNLDI